MKAFNEEIKRLMDELGLKAWGVTDAAEIRKYQGFFDRRPNETVSAFEQGVREERCQTSGNFIAIAFPYAHELRFSDSAGFSVYARGRDYHEVVKNSLNEILRFIRSLGYQAEAYTDNNELPERLIAALAGLGYLGRNSTLITKDYGSYVFLGEIRTDLPLVSSKRTIKPGDYSLCGSCQNCIKACPVKILGNEYVETEQCLSALTQKKRLTLPEMETLQGRLFGCDTCQMVCPHNQDKEGLGLYDFKPYPWMARPDLMELMTLTNSDFKERYRSTAAGWRGRSVIIRNTMIALSHEGRLPEGLSFESPFLKEAYGLLKKGR